MTNASSQQFTLFFRRRTIRRFKSKPVADKDIHKIVETGQRAPSACNLQTYSIVWAKNLEIREQVLDACEVSGSIRSAPVVLVICADVRRLEKTLDYLGADHCLKNDGGHAIRLMSIMDASFVAENMVMAAECLGLGSVFLGAAAANEDVTRILKLPKGVLPLTLLCIGYPDEQPPTRPRLPLSSVLHTDCYEEPSKNEMKAFLKHMDDELGKEGYYQKYARRKPDFRYSDHVQRKASVKNMGKIDNEVLPVMRKAGFFNDENT